MEFSHVNKPSFRGLVNLYYDVLPKLGSIFARNKDAYEYLIESIKLFPNQIELTKKFEYIGFREIECFDIFDGIASIHIEKNNYEKKKILLIVTEESPHIRLWSYYDY